MQKWRKGLRTVCVGCFKPSHFVVATGRRLRTMRCTDCGCRARPTWWCERYPERLKAEHQAAERSGIYLGGVGVGGQEA